MRIPDRATAVFFFRHYLALSLVFFVIYGGTNYLTSLRSDRYRLYADWELGIPFIPSFVYVYLSIFLVFLTPLFTLDRAQIRALSRAFTVATIVAGLTYLLLPAELAVERPETVPGHAWVFAALYKFALPHNLFPSLHITYGTLFLFVVATNERSRLIRAGLALWWALLVVSVIFVRQHHIVDIFGGVLLAAMCYLAVYRRQTQFVSVSRDVSR